MKVVISNSPQHFDLFNEFPLTAAAKVKINVGDVPLELTSTTITDDQPVVGMYNVQDGQVFNVLVQDIAGELLYFLQPQMEDSLVICTSGHDLALLAHVFSTTGKVGMDILLEYDNTNRPMVTVENE